MPEAQEMARVSKRKRRSRDVDAVDGPIAPTVDRMIENNNSKSDASASLSKITPLLTPQVPSASSRLLPLPVSGCWKDGQLHLTSTLAGFLTIAPRDDNGNYLLYTANVKGFRRSPTPHQPVVYTQRSLQELWGCDDAPSVVIIALRTSDEATAFQRQFTLSEIWNLRTSYGGINQLLGKRKQDDEEELRRRHETDSKVLDMDQMINKTNVQRCYRLKGPYLEAVPEPHEGTCYLVSANREVATKLYWERDIEFLAWKMNDGPEGFVQSLYRAYQKYITDLKKPSDSTFPIPYSYEGHFMIIWDTKYPGEPLDPRIESVRPPRTVNLKPMASKGKKKAKLGKPLLPPSKRSRRGSPSPVAGPSSRPSM